MRAVLIERTGEDRLLRMGEAAIPVPAPDQLLVRVHATALDRVDTFIRAGSHGMADAGPVPGRDLAGEVVAVGADCPGFAVGDRVVGTGVGAHAEFALVPVDRALSIPGGWSYVDAAALPTAGRTAYAAVAELADVRSGDKVLVTAAGGGVGSAALQLAALRGAEVIATVGSEWKEQRARDAGARRVVRHDEPGWGARLRAEYGDVDAVIETIGATAWGEALHVLGDGGTLVCCGVSSGHRAEVHIGRVMTRGWRLLGIGRPSRAEVRRHLAATLQSFDEAGIRPIVDRVFALDDAEDAYDTMESSAFFGRIVLTPDGGTR